MIVSYNVTILADSIANGQRLITASFTYPRFIHSEFLRHRMLSHSVESSRAVPTEKIIERVKTAPFIPETFNRRVKGMGVGEELAAEHSEMCYWEWNHEAGKAAESAEYLQAKEVDKSRVNRLLEPFLFVTDLVTGTDWDNFFALRDHPDAQPEFQKIARMIREAFDESEPRELEEGQWHLPLVTADQFNDAEINDDWEYWAHVSAGRCCRWSYGVDPLKAMAELPYDSYARAERLLESFHMSPFEHQARPFMVTELKWLAHTQWMLRADAPTEEAAALSYNMDYSGNLRHWHQFRKTFKHENNFALAR